MSNWSWKQFGKAPINTGYEYLIKCSDGLVSCAIYKEDGVFYDVSTWLPYENVVYFGELPDNDIEIGWNPVLTTKPVCDTGIELLLYNKVWISHDNPTGVRDGFYNNTTGKFISAKRIKDGYTQSVEQPTHWITKPTYPV